MITDTDITHARLALELAVDRLPWVWDDEQRAAIGRVRAFLTSCYSDGDVGTE